MIPLVGPAFFAAQAGAAGASTTKWDSTKKGPNIALSNGDLTAALYANVENFQPENCQMVLGTTAIPSTGKFYWEIELVSISGVGSIDYGAMAGISTTVVSYNSDYPAYKCMTGRLATGYGASGYGYAQRNAGAAPNNGIQPNGGAEGLSIGDRQCVLFDADSRLLRFAFNGVIDTLQNVTVVAATYYPAVSPGILDDNVLTVTAHFSASDWLYSPPPGYTALP